jgi:hypothetical protein
VLRSAPLPINLGTRKSFLVLFFKKEPLPRPNASGKFSDTPPDPPALADQAHPPSRTRPTKAVIA